MISGASWLQEALFRAFIRCPYLTAWGLPMDVSTMARWKVSAAAGAGICLFWVVTRLSSAPMECSERGVVFHGR